MIEAVNRRHQRMQDRLEDNLLDARKNGTDLRRLKHLHRDEFKAWFAAHQKRFGFKYRMAGLYMQVAKYWTQVKDCRTVNEAIRKLQKDKPQSRPSVSRKQVFSKVSRLKKDICRGRAPDLTPEECEQLTKDFRVIFDWLHIGG
jgi:hypothetical protein